MSAYIGCPVCRDGSLDVDTYCCDECGFSVHQLLARVTELEAERDRLLAVLKANIEQARKWRHDAAGHRCGWRVVVEAIEQRSSAVLEDKG